MKSMNIAVLLIICTSIAGCERPNSAARAPTQEAAVATAPAAARVDNLVRNVVADNMLFQPEVARIDGNTLVSTGKAGFMMFGPYVPFAPGTYHVTVQGSIPSLDTGSEVRFDAVSDTASSVHGEHVVNTIIPTPGTIAEFNITIPDGVDDLELRAYVTKGAVVRIESYRVVKAD